MFVENCRPDPSNPKVHQLDFKLCALRTRRSLTHHEIPGLKIHTETEPQDIVP